jgi:hypothetical protein
MVPPIRASGSNYPLASPPTVLSVATRRATTMPQVWRSCTKTRGCGCSPPAPPRGSSEQRWRSAAAKSWGPTSAGVPHLKRELDTFLTTWLRNLKAQGHRLVPERA